MAKLGRVFQPSILQTKEELLVELRNGNIKSSKYHALDEQSKLFVELIVFGNYKPEQAMKLLRPELKGYAAAGRRMLARGDISEVIEELTFKRDKGWMARVTGSRALALDVMEFVMKTTDDEALKVATAKEIIKAADTSIKNNKAPEEQVGGITFNFKFSGGAKDPNNREFDGDDVVIIQGEAAEVESGMPYVLHYAQQAKKNYDPDAVDVVEEDKETE